MEADNKPTCAEVRPADKCIFLKGKEETAMLLNETPILPTAPRADYTTAAGQSERRGSQPAIGGTPISSTLADLNRAFLRQSAQVRAYREKRDEELAEAVGD
jgi:hypothetical protein